MGNAMRGGMAAAVLSTLFFSPGAHAGLIGTASVSDLTLGGSAADAFRYASGVNPQQGKSGNTSGFSSAFAADGLGSWGLLSKFGSMAGNNSSASANGLAMVFNKTDTRHGTWSVTNTNTAKDITLDLVFAMHAGNGSGAWLFDNQFIGAGATLSGVWDLNIFNDGKQYADYSNLTLFGRDRVLTAPVVNTPAPATPAPATPAPATPAPAAPAIAAPAAAAPAADPAPASAHASGGASSAGSGTDSGSGSAPASSNASGRDSAAGSSSAAAAGSPASAPSNFEPAAPEKAGAAPDISGFPTPSEAEKALGETTAGALMPQILNGNAGTSASVPEPASLGIMATGLALLALVMRRRPAPAGAAGNAARIAA